MKKRIVICMLIAMCLMQIFAGTALAIEEAADSVESDSTVVSQEPGSSSDGSENNTSLIRPGSELSGEVIMMQEPNNEPLLGVDPTDNSMRNSALSKGNRSFDPNNFIKAAQKSNFSHNSLYYTKAFEIQSRLYSNSIALKPQDFTIKNGQLVVGYTQAATSTSQSEPGLIATYDASVTGTSKNPLYTSNLTNYGHFGSLTYYSGNGSFYANDYALVRQINSNNDNTSITEVNRRVTGSFQNVWSGMVYIDTAFDRTASLVYTKRLGEFSVNTFFTANLDSGFTDREKYALDYDPKVQKAGVWQFLQRTCQGTETWNNRVYILSDLDNGYEHAITVIDPRDGVVLSNIHFTTSVAGETNGITIYGKDIYFGFQPGSGNTNFYIYKAPIYSDGNTSALVPNVSLGWKKNTTGWWYEYKDGSYPKNSWQYESHYWYYFNSNGYMVTGKQVIGGKTYNFDSSGRCLNPWQ